MNRVKLSTLSAAIVLAIVLLPATAAAAEAPTVSARVGSHGVELAPSWTAPAWQLRVSGPDGQVAEAEFLGNEPLRIDPRLLGSGRWADGTYHYELVPVLGDRQRTDANPTAPATIAAAQSLSGTFAVIGGRVIVAGQASEAGAPRRAAATGVVTPQDVVTPDDAIFQGSICVGFDCVDGESFGFDTVRLKENNTQINFDDTSTSAGFPNNDWTLVANDSASGGAARFFLRNVTSGAVPFSIGAGAATNALFVADTGNVGLGTAVPGLDLHVSTSDTPAFRMEQTSAGGFTAQTWDIGANEANFFVRDVTNGSLLSFRIRPGAPTSSIDVAASGNVGLGTAAPATALHVSDAGANIALRLSATTGLLQSWDISQNAASGRLNITDDITNTRVPLKLAMGAVNNLLRIGLPATNVVEVNGNLNVNGNIKVTGTVGPDYVFAPGFSLPSITDHAAYMFENRHLPNVGAAQVNELGQGVMDLGALSHGMLEELEYAHIYISQLDSTVQELRDELADRDAKLEALQAEVQQIREMLQD